jgi:hypothetical protein
MTKIDSVMSKFTFLASLSPSNLQDFAEESLTKSGFVQEHVSQCPRLRAMCQLPKRFAVSYQKVCHKSH